MAHAQALGPVDYTPRTSYIIIVAVLFAALVLIIVGRGVANTVDNSSAPTSETTNSATPGSTGATGAPTTDTNTPADRTVPSPAGGNANTILNPSGTP
jgi:hypothetical protein